MSNSNRNRFYSCRICVSLTNFWASSNCIIVSNHVIFVVHQVALFHFSMLAIPEDSQLVSISILYAYPEKSLSFRIFLARFHFRLARLSRIISLILSLLSRFWPQSHSRVHSPNNSQLPIFFQNNNELFVFSVTLNLQ